jgi:tripartite motif-containing protein 71
MRTRVRPTEAKKLQGSESQCAHGVAWRVGIASAFFVLLITAICTSFALADEAASPEVPSPGSAEGSSALVEPEPTDPEAAEELPHEELNREEAAELLEGVFEPEVQGAAGIYADLHVEKFLAPNVALIAPGEQPEISGEAGVLEDEGNRAATLLDSTRPLAIEDESGRLEAIDLNLRNSEGAVAPVKPLTESSMPAELGEGIELPGPGITIEPVGVAESRAPSTLGGSAAFYPNVAEETDLAVSPTLGGVETMTQIRSPESPRSETYRLDIPPGASLENEGAGAAVTKGGETLMTVAPPDALDAAGESVPAELSIEGDRLTISITPDEATDYPVLVDPLFESWEWYKVRYGEVGEGWHMRDSMTSGVPWPEIGEGPENLSIRMNSPQNQAIKPGYEGFYTYTVPNYQSNPYHPEELLPEPEAFISHMSASRVSWIAHSTALSPYIEMGLWGPSKGWASLYTHEGLTGHSVENPTFVYPFTNEKNVPDVQQAKIGMVSTESVAQPWAYLRVGEASVELSEPAESKPEFTELYGPTEWVNSAPAPIHFKVKDDGLGIYKVKVGSTASGAEVEMGSMAPGCTGVSAHPCPLNWGPGEIKVNPTGLSTGIDKLNVTTEDPLGHMSPIGHVELAVDHTAPEASLSGSITEMATLGTKRSSYTVKVSAADGTSEHPQSGVAKVFVEFDGELVKQSEPGCATENCQASLAWTLESSHYSAGEHSLRVWAADAAGNKSTPIEREITLAPSPPKLNLSGTMTEQSTLGVARPEYHLQMSGSAEAGIATAPPAPTFSASFGSAGTGNGQFASPGGLARDAAGDIWVTDKGNDRVEEFAPNGGYLGAFGSAGSGPGQFDLPTGIAIGPNGHIWVADSGNGRIEQFDAQGDYISSLGTASGNGHLYEPGSVAVSSAGDVWVTDEAASHVWEFAPGGEVIRLVTGEGVHRLLVPTGVAVSPEGDIWVADTSQDRVDEFGEDGAFIREFGANGTGNGQFTLAGSLTVDRSGNVWVADRGSQRFEEFNSEGQYLTQFGTKGTGEGQMTLQRNSGIAVGPSGRIWTSDNGGKRIEEWSLTRPAPTFSASFGSAGTGNGQFASPGGLARDAAGDIWVTDKGNDRVEEFAPNGGYLGAFGSAGSGPGQFDLPTGIAIGPNGHIWVADSGNGRIEQFDAQGDYISSLGTASGNGHLYEPGSVAVSSAGDVWVTDEAASHVWEFAPGGEVIRLVTGEGVHRLLVPTGVAVSPEGDIWVADTSQDRVDEFGEDGAFIREFGANGTGNGQFTLAGSLTVDRSGNVWVADRGSQRFEEFNSEGQYLTQFGTKGTGEGQMTLQRNSGIAVGPSGRIWTSDNGGKRIEEWVPSDPGSEAITEVAIDGKPVDYDGKDCAAEHCPFSDQWTLESSSVSSGKHEVTVTVSDGLGNSVTRTLPIEIQRDMTSPSLEVGGELANAPEGWVQQETYGVHASATDGGYGVTALVFKIDGQSVTSETATCPEGGCGLSLAFQVNMAEYSGGAHKAEVIATDGAGNRTVKSWTINVDPEGRITTQEETETLEAVESTSEQTPVAPTDQLLPIEQREGGDDPGLKATGAEISSTGVPDVTTMTTDPQDGFSIESPGGTTEITPVVSEGSSTVTVQNGVAGTAANVAKEVDSVIRPEYNGVQIAQAIRSESSPESFSWVVHLAARQELILVNPTQAEVVYTDGTESFLINAEPAHDATGKPVPTALEVHGGELTVKVEFHAGNFVFPIIAGEGWETSYESPVIVEGPEDETQIREREEREAREQGEEEGESDGPEPSPPSNSRLSESEGRRILQFRLVGNETIPAPEPSAPPIAGVATASSIPERVVKPLKICEIDHCSIWRAEVRNPSYLYVKVYRDQSGNFYSYPGRGRVLVDAAYWRESTQVHCESNVGTLYAIAGVSVTHPDPWCDFAGKAVVSTGEHKHLTAWGRFSVNANVWVPLPDDDVETFVRSAHYALLIWVWPNGWQEHRVREWTPGPFEEVAEE